jgi:hypothetical protein
MNSVIAGILCVVFLILLALVVLVLVLGLHIVQVREEQRLVIYRRGRFNRVDGPGWVRMTRFETIERRLNVRDATKNFTVVGLFIFGVPIGFTLNFWLRTDLQRAAAGDFNVLRRLAMFTDGERDQQVAVEIMESFKRRIAELERHKENTGQMPGNIVEQIIPILPGSPDCEELLGRVKGDLMRKLPSVGAVIDPSHPLIITSIIPPPEMLAGFSRGRILALLRLSLPQLPEDKLANMLAAIEGLSGMTTRVHDIRGPEGAPPTTSYRIRGDNIEPTFLGTAAQPAALAQAEPARAIPIIDAVPAKEEEVSSVDLKVLKRVPR